MKYLLFYEYLISLIYKHRNEETRSMSLLLAYLLLFLNSHSLLIWLELRFNIVSVSQFWRPTSGIKAPIGFLLGILLYIIIHFIRRFTLTKYSKIQRVKLFRQMIRRFGTFKKVAVLYIIITLLIMLWSIITLTVLIHG
jgi:hypothetical protein